MEVNGPLYFRATMFGDHTLHHLLPSVDSSKLPQLYPALLKTCQEFGIPYTEYTFTEMFVGLYRQIMNKTPNTLQPFEIERKALKETNNNYEHLIKES